MSNHQFSIVPIEVATDDRLTKRQIKVLIALFSFRGKNTNTVFPSRQKLSDRCGIRVQTISQTTSELVELGWLKKEGKGGYSKATRYTITVPETSTVHELGTVHELSTGGVLKTGTGMGVLNLGTGKEVTNNRPEEQESEPKGSSRQKIPFEKIVKLYHEKLPMLPSIHSLTKKRKSQIRARWLDGSLPNLEVWEEYFDHVAESKFLTGQVTPHNGRKPFVANLEWITTESNFTNIAENKYHG